MIYIKPQLPDYGISAVSVDQFGLRSDPVEVLQLHDPNKLNIRPENEILFKVLAVYDYIPDKMSPNFDKSEELTFRKGDIMSIFGEIGK